MAEAVATNLLVLDVGGSHISGAVFDLGREALGDVAHVAVPSDGSTEDFLNSVAALCKRISQGIPAIAGLSAALPNPFDYERGISHMRHKFQQLYGVDLRRALSECLNRDPGDIHFLNDAAAFLIGELHQGAAVGVDRAVGITLGTGIGSAFAIQGHTVVEGFGVPPGGEVWDLPYRGGIVEDFAGTAAIKRLHFELTGTQAEVHEIAAAATRDGDGRRTFERFGTELGKLLRFTTVDFDPRRIVIGGRIALSSALFFPAAQRELAGLATEICASQLAGNAPLIGAAMSWSQRTTPA